MEPDEEAQAFLPKKRRPFRMPDFARREKPLSGTEKGSATHLVLQYMDFARTQSLEAVRGEIERLRIERFLTDREAGAVDAEAVFRLFSSPLGQRMLSGAKLHREFKFSLLVDASLLGAEPGEEELLLQGVVDCCLEEEDALTVIDYKTDRLRNRAECEERAFLYVPQLTAYARALTRIFQKPVKECALYFLSAGETVVVEMKNDGDPSGKEA